MRGVATLLAGLLALVLFIGPLGQQATTGTAGPTHFQAAFSDLVPCHAPSYPGNGGCEQSNQRTITNATSVFTWQRDLLPFTVPPGKELHITDAHFANKHVCNDGDCRNSYMVIEGVGTVTPLGPFFTLSSPFIIPSGQTLRVTFINNDPEPEWMNGFITGWLVDTPLSTTPAATATVGATSPAVTATVGVPSPTPSATASPVATATRTPTPLATATPRPCPSWAWWC